MTLVIEIAPELEKKIRHAASEAGLSLDAFIVESVTERLHSRPQKSRPKRLPKKEAQLLLKINHSLDTIDWTRYRTLIERRQAELLTEAEHRELIALSDRIEEANVKRIEYLAELAQVRKTTLPSLMKELGLKPASYA